MPVGRDERKPSDLNRGPKRTRPKYKRPEEQPRNDHPVTDHAVLRYMERVLGMDVQVLRETMLTAEQLRMASELKHCRLPLGGGVQAVVVGGKVVTIK